MKYYFYFGLLSLLLFSCRKKENPVEVKYIQPEVSLNSWVSLDLIDNTSGSYDTLVTFSADVVKKNSSSANYVIDYDAAITCNGLQEFHNASYPVNKGGLFYPNCILEAKSTEYDVINFNDTTSLPYFTNNNWWNFPDSINANQNFVMDFSSFKNYTDIKISAYLNLAAPSLSNKFYNVSGPVNSFTIASQELSNDYKGLKNIIFEVSFSKITNLKLSDKALLYSQKSIRFYKHAKFY